MFNRNYLTGSEYYRDFIKNISIFKGLYNIIKNNLKKQFNTLNIGKKAIKTKESAHRIYKNDAYMKIVREGMEIIPAFNEFILNFFKNVKYENLLIFEREHQFFLTFIEIEKYLNKCFRYAIKLDNSMKVLENKDIDKYIHDVFYKGLNVLFQIAKNELNIKHKLDNNLVKILSCYREIRNLYIHKDGIVDSRFLKKIQEFDLTLNDLGLNELRKGEKLEITDDIILKMQKLSLDIISKFDIAFNEIYE